jgi:hypothetical protein
MIATEVLRHYAQAKTTHILMMFKGGLSQNIVVDLGGLLQKRLGFDAKVRKMFSIFVEMAQNIKNYSDEKEISNDGAEVGVGILLLADTGSHYELSCGNLVRNEKVPTLKAQCEYLKSLDKEGLKAYHEERIDSDPPPGSKGAGLGLIDISIKSNANAVFDFVRYDNDYVFFSITAHVSK